MTGKEIVTGWLESRHGCFYGRHEVVGEPCLAEAINAAVADRDAQLYRLGDELAEARLEIAKKDQQIADLQKRIDNSLVENCHFISRQPSSDDLIFNGEDALVRLVGYTVLPNEQYAALQAATRRVVEALWAAKYQWDTDYLWGKLVDDDVLADPVIVALGRE
jgi:hypothetical protein